MEFDIYFEKIGVLDDIFKKNLINFEKMETEMVQFVYSTKNAIKRLD